MSSSFLPPHFRLLRGNVTAYPLWASVSSYQKHCQASQKLLESPEDSVEPTEFQEWVRTRTPVWGRCACLPPGSRGARPLQAAAAPPVYSQFGALRVVSGRAGTQEGHPAHGLPGGPTGGSPGASAPPGGLHPLEGRFCQGRLRTEGWPSAMSGGQWKGPHGLLGRGKRGTCWQGPCPAGDPRGPWEAVTRSKSAQNFFQELRCLSGQLG